MVRGRGVVWYEDEAGCGRSCHIHACVKRAPQSMCMCVCIFCAPVIRRRRMGFVHAEREALERLTLESLTCTLLSTGACVFPEEYKNRLQRLAPFESCLASTTGAYATTGTYTVCGSCKP